MNRLFKLLVVSFLCVFLSAGVAMALTLDGNMGDWNTAHYEDGEDIPYSDNGYLGPGWGGQAFDVEKIGLFIDSNRVYFGLQTGFNFIDGVTYNSQKYYAGDIFIDFGKDGWDLAVDISGVDAGDSSGFSDDNHAPFKVYDVSTSSDPTFGVSEPYKEISNGSGMNLENSGALSYTNGDGEVTYGIEGSFLLAGSWASLLDSYNQDGAKIHWTMSCGNDVLEYQAAVPTPEPASLLLLGTGLIGLAGVSRKKLCDRK